MCNSVRRVQCSKMPRHAKACRGILLVSIYLVLMIPAFLRALNAPSFVIVRSPRVDTGRIKVLLSSATKTFVLCIFGYFRTIPVGLNFVARVLLEYPPAMIEPFLVIAHVFAIYFV